MLGATGTAGALATQIALHLGAGRVIAAILRARRITISGSGGGSIDPGVLFRELPKLLDAAAAGALTTAVRTARLEDVAMAWREDAPGRLVLTMG